MSKAYLHIAGAVCPMADICAGLPDHPSVCRAFSIVFNEFSGIGVGLPFPCIGEVAVGSDKSVLQTGGCNQAVSLHRAHQERCMLLCS